MKLAKAKKKISRCSRTTFRYGAVMPATAEFRAAVAPGAAAGSGTGGAAGGADRKAFRSATAASSTNGQYVANTCR